MAGSIFLANPGVPALSGYVFRVASAIQHPVTGVLRASQGEELVLQ